MTIRIRPACLEDVGTIEEIIRESVFDLQRADYTLEQIQGALGTVYGVDLQMIGDGTYYVAGLSSGNIVACGGWSNRRTPFGGDRSPKKDDSFLDPSQDAARIRAFFVRPAYVRQGIGKLLYETCRDGAQQQGFRSLQLTATLTGVPLYLALGFTEDERLELSLPNGATLPVIRMIKTLY